MSKATLGRLALLLGGLAVVGLYLGSVSTKLRFGGDAVDFLALADSLSQGRNYTINGVFTSVWPPMTPIILAAGKLATLNLYGLKVFLLLFGLAGLWMAWKILNSHYDSNLGTFAIFLAAVAFPTLYWLVDISTESTYLFFSMSTLFLGSKCFKEKQNIGLFVLTGVCMGLAILARTIGISLLVGFVLTWAICCVRRRLIAYRPAITLIVTLLIAGGWYLYSWSKSGQTSLSVYAKISQADATVGTPPPARMDRLTKNMIGYALIFSTPDASLRDSARPRLSIRALLSLGIMGLAVGGFLWHLIKRPQFPETYLVIYGGILLTFNWYDIRYLVPILPFWFYYLGFVIAKLCGWISDRLEGKRLAYVAMTAIMGLLLIANLFVSIASPQAKRLRSPQYQGAAKELYDATLWVKANEPNAIVMCRWANMTWFWTGLKVESVPLIADPDAMWQHMQRAGVTVVIADPDEFSGLAGKYLDPALSHHPEQAKLVRTFGRTRIFHIRSRTSDL